ncbi:LptF/LptG family permease [Simkania negevensis]|uniref:LptF/LptG family permease n=1 Tax=Simkania negevensis TaxID=83561 RepID=A0ABS3ARY1_9BACT|nr:LptF/LptG family permease [Simkania negevensis]
MQLKIWNSYAIKETLKVFILFILCFYSLYVLIDFSLHMHAFQQNRATISALIAYYSYSFSYRAEILIPFALLLASIKVLSTMNANNEIVALLVAGVPLKKVMQPFLLLAIAFCALLYFNLEFFLPSHAIKLEQFEETYLHGVTNRAPTKVHVFPLPDDSTLVYQKYDFAQEAFFDAYWIRPNKEIWRAKYLFPHTEKPIGLFVDRLVHNSAGQIERTESLAEHLFSDLHIDEKLFIASVIPAEYQPISQLWHAYQNTSDQLNDREIQLVTTLFKKITLPLLALLVVVCSFPFCLNFERNKHPFALYSLAIFSLVALYTLLSATTILAENRIVHPAIAMWAPLFLCTSCFGWKYLKLR